ncbi:MAG: tetratricopeptide repeat protein [Deltaproteobacteria bacterium]|nr:tetratricopeptide repeat protein [Deltaproteobacteria bacterium]
MPLLLLTLLLLLTPPALPAPQPTLETVVAEMGSIDALIAAKDWVTAESRAELHHQQLQRAFGEDHRITAVAAVQLALTRLALGDQDSAFDLLAQAMPILIAELGHADPMVIYGENLRVALVVEREPAEVALAVAADLVSGREAALGPTALDTIRALELLLSAQKRAFLLEECEQTQTRVIHALGASLGPTHPRTLAAWGQLAALVELRGDSARSYTLAAAAVAEAEASLGPADPVTLELGMQEARALHRTHRYAASLARIEALDNLAHSALGEDHPVTWRIMGAHVEALVRVHRGEEALVLAQALVRRNERVHGRTSPEARLARMSLLGPLFETGALHDARREAEGVRLAALSQQGEASVMGAMMSLFMASMDEALTRHHRALRGVRDAMDGLTQALGPGHMTVLNAMVAEIRSLMSLGRVEEAQRRLSALEREAAQANNVEYAHHARILRVELLRRAGDHAAALPLAADLAAESLRDLGPEHSIPPAALAEEGRAAFALGDLPRARAALSQAFKAELGLCGPTHPYTGYAAWHLRLVLEALGEPIPDEVTAAVDALIARRPDTLSVPEIREAREEALKRR